MPCFTINTNIHSDKVPQDIFKKASALIAKALSLSGTTVRYDGFRSDQKETDAFIGDTLAARRRILCIFCLLHGVFNSTTCFIANSRY
ncbi:unnamed protein product [Toxocara canis]|uniref:5-carboxymethyl-2-hydroxymuconate Delta-isomerase n=1 Tax=Toxocara canis TaxID=6265 RepID=A0A183VGV2_TOXCA|nr:unnamed protein product [Toxocara canis]